VIPSLSDFKKFQNLTHLCFEKLWLYTYRKIHTGGAWAKKSRKKILYILGNTKKTNF
jgi:hypothetical protein